MDFYHSTLGLEEFDVWGLGFWVSDVLANFVPRNVEVGQELGLRQQGPLATPECWKGLPKVNLSFGAVVVKSHLRLQ